MKSDEEEPKGGRGRAKYGSHFVLFISFVGLVCRVDGARTLNRKEYDNVLSCLNSSDSWIEVEEMKMALLNNIK